MPSSSSRPQQHAIEWAFIAAMVVLCATLTALQYRWTGALARAEMERLRGNLGEQTQQLARAFDAELTAGCAQLLPTAAEIDRLGREPAHAARLHQWLAGKPRPIFRRLAVAVPEGATLQLFALEQKSARFALMEWPPEWSELRDNLMRKLAMGSPPYLDREGMLLEFPIFGGRERGESEWTIFELDRTYLCDTWLPSLVRKHLNPDGTPLHSVLVKTVTTPASTLYASDDGQAAREETPVVIRFNREGRDAGDFPGQPEDPAWILEARRRPGVLDATVTASRRRNLAVAVALNALILGAGWLLLRHTRRARQLAEAQMQFVANVSHELRTPLTVIRGAAHNLERGVVQEPGRIAQYSALILQHVEQLTGMVEQVLEFSGAQRNAGASPRRPVSIAEILSDSIAASDPDTRAAHCRVELTIPSILPVVQGDANALRRLFQNLIANAAKHGGTGGWIGITASLTKSNTPPAIEVQVADRGPGIPESEQAEIFQPFVRGSAAQSAQVRGSGLGLSLVREIVEAHGGAVSVQSERGHGTTFTVKLPVR